MATLHRPQPPTAVFRCDASAATGRGHLARCIALAEALVDLDWQVRFAVSRESLPAVRQACAHLGTIIVLAGEPDSEPGEIGDTFSHDAALLVVDHYGLGADFECACRAWADRILVISDVPDRPHDADFLLDDNFGRVAIDYRGLLPKRCGVIAGSRFALLNRTFAAARTGALQSRRRRQGVARLFIAMGAADQGNATGKVLEALKSNGLPCGIDVVLGADAPNREAIDQHIEALPQTARLHSGIGADAVAELMIGADLAIGAGGAMSWERCCLGLPTLVITTGRNQEAHAANLAAAGAVMLLGRDEDVPAEAIAARLLTAAADPKALERMSMAASHVCDGYGARRVAAIVNSAVRGSNPPGADTLESLIGEA